MSISYQRYFITVLDLRRPLRSGGRQGVAIATPEFVFDTKLARFIYVFILFFYL